MKIEDLFPNVDRWEIPDNYYQNLVALLPKLNLLEDAFGPLEVTSGFRTWAHHKEIYRHINDVRVMQHKGEIPIPLHSAHLTGNAVDLFDPKRTLKQFLADQRFLKENELWAESFQSTPSWTHLQNIPYRSFVPGGTRFFKP